MSTPVITPKRQYDPQNEAAFREEVRRTLRGSYGRFADLIVPFGKRLGFTSAQGQEISFGYNADGEFTIQQDAETPFGLASIDYVTTVESTLEGSIATLETTLRAEFEAGDADVTALITTEATTRASADSALASRASALEASVDTPTTGLLARVTVAEAAIVTNDGAIAAVETEVSAARDGEATLLAKINAVDAAIVSGDAAIASSVTTLSATVSGHTSSISTNAAAIATVDGKLSASYGVTVDAGGRIASLKLLSNGTTSGVAFKADAFDFFDGITDRALLSAAGGLFTVNGDLAVTGAIRVGEIRWPVALKPVPFYVADGGTIEWAGGAALSAVPDYTITVPGGVALAAGEAWEPPTLQSATTTGATLRLKISTPGSTSSVTDTTDSAGGGGDPDRVMDKADASDAYNGIYNFRVQGTLTVTSSVEPDFYGPGVDLWVHYGTAIYSTWFNDGGGSDEGPNFVVSVVDVLGFDTSTSDESGSHSFDLTKPITWANAIGQHGGKEWGVSLESGGTLTDFVSVQYIKQSASGTRTGSPNGETATVLVIPKNI